MTETGAEIVPFGKYRGQTVDTLIADDGYRDWLLSQPWFRQRFGNLYQVVINYGAEPQDSPEHNEMQVAFLDDDRCMALARLLYPGRAFDGSKIKYTDEDQALHDRFRQHLERDLHEARVTERQFEVGGWDATFRVATAYVRLQLTSLPACQCVRDDHASCPPMAKCQGGAFEWACFEDKRRVPTLLGRYNDDTVESNEHFDTSAHTAETCPWSDERAVKWLRWGGLRWWSDGADTGTICVELKPDLGDDFPTVLRQVDSYKGGARQCVVVRRHQFERVTWEQVSQVFAASGIQLVREADLSDA